MWVRTFGAYMSLRTLAAAEQGVPGAMHASNIPHLVCRPQRRKTLSAIAKVPSPNHDRQGTWKRVKNRQLTSAQRREAESSRDEITALSSDKTHEKNKFQSGNLSDRRFDHVLYLIYDRCLW